VHTVKLENRVRHWAVTRPEPAEMTWWHVTRRPSSPHT